VGKEKDSESGLYYFGARYMDAGVGRFASIDPIRAVDPNTGKVNSILLSNPQRLNLYAYAGNNPYKYIDPDGEWMLIIEYNKNAQYGSMALVWNGWLPDGIFDMKTRGDSNGANAAAKSGIYDYKLGKHEGTYFAKHDALIINDGGKVDTVEPNANQGGKSIATGLHSHAGNPEIENGIKAGSEACWVVPTVRGKDTYRPNDPSTWKYYNEYISTFKDNPTGKALLLRLDW
jgi:RHS repeat-associated protein